MTTINFLTSHFLPENTACVNRVLAYLDVLKHDYMVNVICLTEKGAQAPQQEPDLGDSIKTHYIPQEDFDGTSFVKRGFHEILHLRRLIKQAKNLEASVTIATAPYMFMIPLVAYRVKGQKILDLRDLVWEYLDETGLVKKFIKKIVSFVIDKSLNKFDAIIVTNHYEYQLVNKRYNGPINIIPNGIDKAKFDKLKQIPIKPVSPFTVTYIGNIGLAQNVITLVKAASKLPQVNFNIVGNGVQLDDIKEYINEHQLNNVHLYGKLDWNEVIKHYETTSILYAQLSDKYLSAVPSKVYEYVVTGLPVIYGGYGQALDLLSQFENTYLVPPDDIEALVSAIQDIAHQQHKTVSDYNQSVIESYYLRDNNARKIKELV